MPIPHNADEPPETVESLFARQSEIFAFHLERMGRATTAACRAADAVDALIAESAAGLKFGNVLGREFDRWAVADNEVRSTREKWESAFQDYREMTRVFDDVLEHIAARVADSDGVEEQHETPRAAFYVVPREGA